MNYSSFSVKMTEKNCKILYSNPSNLSLYLLYYAEAKDEFAGSISASLRPGSIVPFEKMFQRWQHCVRFDLPGPRFEARTSRSRDERVTAPPTGRLFSIKDLKSGTYLGGGIVPCPPPPPPPLGR